MCVFAFLSAAAAEGWSGGRSESLRGERNKTGTASLAPSPLRHPCHSPLWPCTSAASNDGRDGTPAVRICLPTIPIAESCCWSYWIVRGSLALVFGPCCIVQKWWRDPNLNRKGRLAHIFLTVSTLRIPTPGSIFASLGEANTNQSKM